MVILKDDEIAKIMRTTRSKYHYDIRYAMENDEVVKKNATEHCILEIIFEIYGNKLINLERNQDLIHNVWILLPAKKV